MDERNWRHSKNDGWTDIEYDFGLGQDAQERVNGILNEACHVFRHHAEGCWKSADKDSYAKLLMTEMLLNPGLSSRLLRCGDRVVKMITYRALEIIASVSSSESQHL